MALQASVPRPFTPRQQRENAAFLAALRRTGNVRLACRELHVHRSTYTKRRAKCAAFATSWDMALAAAHAAFRLAGGTRMPASGEGTVALRPDLKTRGGEPMIVRQGNGRLQLRLAPPGRMTEAAERLYLATLGATANIRLSARVAGFAHSSFYARRNRWVGFHARMGQALKLGYDRIEYVVMERTLQALTNDPDHAGWLAGAITDNPLPPLTFGQAFQVLCLHRNTVRLDGMRPPGRRSKVEPSPGAAMFALGRNIDAITRANHYHTTGTWTLPGEPAAAPKLPPMEQVSGWSKAAPEQRSGRATAGSSDGDGACRPTGPAEPVEAGARSTSRVNGPVTVRVTWHPDRALFGGWRLDTWEKRKRSGA